MSFVTAQHLDSQQTVSQQPLDQQPVEPNVSDQADITETGKEKLKTTKVSNKIFGTWDDEPIRASVGSEKIKASPEQQFGNWKNRKYRGGFFYLNDDQIWVVDMVKYDLVLWKMLGKGASITDPYFNIDTVREIEPDSDEMYYPDLDPGPNERAAQEIARWHAAIDASRESSHSSSSSDSSNYEKPKGRGGGYGYGKHS